MHSFGQADPLIFTPTRTQCQSIGMAHIVADRFGCRAVGINQATASTDIAHWPETFNCSGSEQYRAITA